MHQWLFVVDYVDICGRLRRHLWLITQTSKNKHCDEIKVHAARSKKTIPEILSQTENWVF